MLVVCYLTSDQSPDCVTFVTKTLKLLVFAHLVQKINLHSVWQTYRLCTNILISLNFELSATDLMIYQLLGIYTKLDTFVRRLNGRNHLILPGITFFSNACIDT